MILRAGQDDFGNIEHFTSNNLRRILDLIDGYMKDVPYTISEIRQDDVNDKYGRVDIEIRYVNKNHQSIQQKLLILNGELIDGEMFHKRFHEWYK